MIAIPTRPQKINGILKTGFRIWKGSFKAVIPFSLLFAAVTVGYEYLLCLLGIQYDLAYNVFFYYSENNSKVMLATLVFLAMVFILNSGLIYQMDEAVRRGKSKFHEGLLVGFEKSLAFFLVSLVALLMISLGTLLFFIPGIIFSVSIIFSPYLVVLSDKGVFGSIRESFRLIGNHWWFTATVFFVLTLGFLALSIVLGTLTISGDALRSLLFSDQAFAFHNNAGVARTIDFVIIAVLYPLFNACILSLLYSLQAKEKKKA